jgi:hypothetical protein
MKQSRTFGIKDKIIKFSSHNYLIGKFIQNYRTDLINKGIKKHVSKNNIIVYIYNKKIHYSFIEFQTCT